MKATHTIFFTQRNKYLLVISATMLPVVSFMLLVFLTSYQPVFNCLENIVKIGHDKVQPLQNLRFAVLNAIMPPNDYLIHGSEEEKQNWENLKVEVNNAFLKVFAEKRLESNRQILLSMEEQWKQAIEQGDLLFMVQKSAYADHDFAEAMEIFDASIDKLSLQLSQLVSSLNDEINIYYNQIESLKYRGIVLTLTAIFSGMLLGAFGSIWLTKDREKIVSKALYDTLTGVFNRRALEDELAKMEKYQLACHPPSFSLLMIDLDDFKLINDQYGHDAGDIALKTFADLTSKMIRNDDVFGRYGGEEFLVLLPGTDNKEARLLAERIRQGIESAHIEIPGDGELIKLTVSIGGATFSRESDNIEDVLKAADSAMYQAKNEGRNRVVFGQS